MSNLIFNKLQKMINNGTFPRFDTPSGFSEFLCQAYVPKFKTDNKDLEAIEREQNDIIDQVCEGIKSKKKYQKDATSFYLDALEIAERLPRYIELKKMQKSKSGPLNPEVEDIHNKIDNLIQSGRDYKANFQRYTKIVAPTGMYAARGLHSFLVPFLPDLWELLVKASSLVSEENYSQNIAAASAMFAFPSFPFELAGTPASARPRSSFLGAPFVITDSSNDDYFKEDFGHYAQAIQRHYLHQYLREHGISANKTNMIQAIKELSCGVLIVAKIPHQYLLSYGGDSESGDLLEAEIKVKPCLDKCIQNIFVISAVQPSNSILATLNERKQYCLSYYNIAFLDTDTAVRLHADVKCPTNGMSNFIKIRTPLDDALYQITKDAVASKLLKWQEEYFSRARWYKIL